MPFEYSPGVGLARVERAVAPIGVGIAPASVARAGPDSRTGPLVVAPYYSELGRPSIDPVLMIRMLIVGYVFAIRSERQICRERFRSSISPPHGLSVGGIMTSTPWLLIFLV